MAKVVHCTAKLPIEKVDLALHAHDMQAIMINPPWCFASKKQSKKKPKTIDMEEFSNL